MVQEIKNQIEKGNIKESIILLKKLTNDRVYENDSILISSRFESIENERNKGIISSSEYRLEKNIIVNDILNVCGRIEEKNVKKNHNVRVQLIIEGDVKKFSYRLRLKLLKLLAILLEIPENEIKILNVVDGSIKLIISIPKESKDMLINCFKDKDNRIRPFKIVDIIMLDSDTLSDEKCKILYIDDELINLQLFKINFSKKYEVSIAENGLKGLAILAENPDIKFVVSDIKMPTMSNIQFIKQAKEKYPDIKFYILTGVEIPKEIKEAIKPKLILNYYDKPYNMNDLYTKILESIGSE